MTIFGKELWSIGLTLLLGLLLLAASGAFTQTGAGSVKKDLNGDGVKESELSRSLMGFSH